MINGPNHRQYFQFTCYRDYNPQGHIQWGWDLGRGWGLKVKSGSLTTLVKWPEIQALRWQSPHTKPPRSWSSLLNIRLLPHIRYLALGRWLNARIPGLGLENVPKTTNEKTCAGQHANSRCRPETASRRHSLAHASHAHSATSTPVSGHLFTRVCSPTNVVLTFSLYVMSSAMEA